MAPMERDTPQDVNCCARVALTCVLESLTRTLAVVAITEEMRRRIREYVRTLNDDAPQLTERDVRELRAIIHPRLPRETRDDAREDETRGPAE